MATSLNFPSIAFANVTYGTVTSGRTSIPRAPTDAKLTAKIVGGNGWVTVRMSAETLEWEPAPPGGSPRPASIEMPSAGVPGRPPLPGETLVGIETSVSDGTTPLQVKLGQTVNILVTVSVPSQHLTPGPVPFTLQFQSDSWTVAPIAMAITLIAVDESTPIGIKWVASGGLQGLGAVLANAAPMPDGIGSYQEFQNGTIFYSPDFGASLISQPLYQKLNSQSVAATKTATGQFIRDYLGYPTGDSFATLEGAGQAAYFETGMLVLRANKQAWAVYGLIYQHYRALGNIGQGSKNPPVVGLPLSDEQPAANGRMSQFDAGTIYWSSDTGAWETHGLIRDRYLALGGPGGLLGFPTSDEMPVMNGTNQVGRFNTFQGGMRAGARIDPARIYWSAGTGAWEVYGAIKAAWLAGGGPIGPLGFPTSGETDTPGGGRFNSFQNGVVVWHADGVAAGAFPVQGLAVNLFSYADSKHTDFNVQHTVSDSTGQVEHGRDPPSDNYHHGNQQFTPPMRKLSIAKVTHDYTIDVWMECIHENTIGKDDRDGVLTAHFDIDNLWGLKDTGAYKSDGGLSIVMKVEPEPQSVATDSNRFSTTVFWPFQNWGGPTLSWKTYSETFSDVSPSDDDFNLGTIFPWNWHLAERIFFEAVYKGLSNGGNCFGMCLEANYAQDYLTPFVEPIYSSPFNTYRKDGSRLIVGNQGDSMAVDQINIKHGYQVGASFLIWALNMWEAGAFHDPVRAFRESRDAFARGERPMLTLSKDSELSGDGHVVLPFAWSPPTEADIAGQPLSGQTWTIFVANPNYPGAAMGEAHSKIVIDPFAQTFTFQFGDSDVWSGSNSSGGRLLSIPFSVVNQEPMTSVNAVDALLGNAVLCIMGGDAAAAQITDEAGRTFYAAQTPAAGGQQRQVNRDAASRIPNLMLVPLSHSAVDAFPAVAPGGGMVFGTSAGGSSEMYFAQRSASGFTWSTPVTPSAAAAESGIARAVDGLTLSLPGLPRPMPPQSALSFLLKGSGAGSYLWSILSPRMSVNVSAPTAAGSADLLTVTQSGPGSHSITLEMDRNAQARKLSLKIAGWRGDHAPQSRSFQLDNLTAQPGHTMTASVKDSGKELWLENAGAATSFDLTLYAGPSGQTARPRSNLAVEANATARIRPAEWNPATIGQTAIALEVRKADGTILRHATI